MISFGTGGHSSEMLSLVENAKITQKIGKTIDTVTCVVSDDDILIHSKLDKVFAYENSTSGQQQETDSNSNGNKIVKIALKRPRKVGQSYLTSIFTTIMGIFQALHIIYSKHPQILITNGPGISVALALSVLILRIVTLGLSYKCKIIFVESVCRTKSLSMSGKLIYHFCLYSEFYVQWADLQKKYPGTTYVGILV